MKKHALIELLTGKINYDRYPLSPRIRILQGILAKIEPRPTVTAAPVPAAKPDDRPRAALAAMKRAADEIRTRPADDVRRRCHGRGPAYSVVPGVRRRVEPDPAALAERYGAAIPVLGWKARLVCSGCGSREVDMVVTETKRP